MCEYCEGKKKFEDIKDIDIFEVGILNGKELEVLIDFGNSDAFYNEYFKINYCPMCGRRVAKI